MLLSYRCRTYVVQRPNIDVEVTYPIVVMKLVVNESSEKRRSRQLFPTPANREEELLKACTGFKKRGF
jgi:hypothetical protein